MFSSLYLRINIFSFCFLRFECYHFRIYFVDFYVCITLMFVDHQLCVPMSFIREGKSSKHMLHVLSYSWLAVQHEYFCVNANLCGTSELACILVEWEWFIDFEWWSSFPHWQLKQQDYIIWWIWWDLSIWEESDFLHL